MSDRNLFSRLLLVLLTFGLVAFVSACGGNTFVVPTPRPPTATPTERSTPLPTVATQIPLGSSERAYHVALVAANKNASGSELGKLLSNEANTTITVDLLDNTSDVLTQLCGDKPTFAWLDGRGLLAAQSQGCGSVALRYLQGSSTGVKADLIVRTGQKDPKDDIKAISGLRGKDFCRLNGQDVPSWILPALAMRAAGLNPALDLKGIREFSDTAALLQALADGLCAGVGIPAGTLSQFSPKLTQGQLTVLQTTPELPFGGLLVATTIPKPVADAVINYLAKDDDPLRTLLGVNALAKASDADFADFQKLAQNAGLNLKTLGQ